MTEHVKPFQPHEAACVIINKKKKIRFREGRRQIRRKKNTEMAYKFRKESYNKCGYNVDQTKDFFSSRSIVFSHGMCISWVTV